MDETFVSDNIAHALGWLDLAVLGASIAVLLVIAYLSGRKEADTQDFFLGRRSVPAAVACLSFVAAEISAVTIVGVPAIGFKENWQYLQFFIGSAGARILIALLFIPVFYRLNCTTIYEFLLHRFGSQTQYAGSVFFFITRLLGSAVRLYAASLGIAVILGWSLGQSILLFTVVGIAFIAFGGIKAVVWTGAFEAAMFYVAGIAVGGYLLAHIDGGLAEIWRTAGPAGRLDTINLAVSLKDPNTLWAAVLGTAFMNASVFGTDQDFMQRLLTVRTRRSSQKALLGTILAGMPLVFIYLSVGTLLFVYYRQNPALPPPDNADKILSHFTVYGLPMGLKGLVLSAIVLASIDSPLSSLSSSFVTDIYRPLIHRAGSERHYLWVSRAGVIGFGIVLSLMAYGCKDFEGILWVALQVIGITGGSLLGVFLLGLLTRRPANRANVVAMTASAVAMAVLLYLSRTGRIPLAWTWLILIGTAMTFGLGWLLGPLLDRDTPRRSAAFSAELAARD
jgi:SSS family solute:Na+ symporter